jgi:hypothetical protein
MAAGCNWQTIILKSLKPYCWHKSNLCACSVLLLLTLRVIVLIAYIRSAHILP